MQTNRTFILSLACTFSRIVEQDGTRHYRLSFSTPVNIDKEQVIDPKGKQL